MKPNQLPDTAARVRPMKQLTKGTNNILTWPAVMLDIAHVTSIEGFSDNSHWKKPDTVARVRTTEDQSLKILIDKGLTRSPMSVDTTHFRPTDLKIGKFVGHCVGPNPSPKPNNH